MTTTPAPAPALAPALDLPKGVQLVEYKLKNGTTSTRFRLRRRTKTENINKYFDTYEELISFLNNIQQEKKEDIKKDDVYKTDEAELIIKEFIDSTINDPFLSVVANQYIINFLSFDNLDDIKTLNQTAYRNRLRALLETEVKVPLIKGFSNVFDDPKKIGEFRISEIDNNVINAYIKARIELKKAKATIQKELSIISNLFNSIDELFNISVVNPVLTANKSILKRVKTTVRKRYITEEEDLIFKEELSKKKNKQLLDIVLLASFTSLRRSEIIYLTWNQIDDTYIHLENTKNGEERIVWLNEEARLILSAIERKEGQERLFTYKIEGFKTAWQRFQKSLKIEKINFHDLRKKFITEIVQRQINESGIASVFAVGTALGVKDLDYLKRTYVNIEEAKIRNKMRANQSMSEEELRQNSGHKDYRTQQIYITKLSQPK